MAILQLPKQQRHPDVEEFILSHFDVPTFTEIDERYRSFRVKMGGVDEDQVIDLALIKIVQGVHLGYQINSALSILAGDFIETGYEGHGGFCDIDPTKKYQGFKLYWRPQKKDPFEWLHERGFHVVAS
jgi:hypothetical protein